MGMTARVEIPILAGSQVLAVPREFLHRDTSGQMVVFKVPAEPGKPGLRQVVQTGVFNSRLVEIVKGVAVGEILYEGAGSKP